jgi:uncharacterized protein YjbI with pentapeptide repeats
LSAQSFMTELDHQLDETMPDASERDPRAPQLALDLETPGVMSASEVFVDDAFHEGLRLKNAQCSEAVATGVELRSFVLSEVDLSGAKLDRLDLQDGSIKHSNLANLRSQSCSLHRVEIEACRLTGTMLVEPRLLDVVFRNSPIDLSSFRFGHLSRVRFEGCRLVEADFQAVKAKACTFIDCDLSGAQLSQGSFAGSAFRGCRLDGVHGLEALKGAQMAWGDIMELATALAASLGIEVCDDIS